MVFNVRQMTKELTYFCTLRNKHTLLLVGVHERQEPSFTLQSQNSDKSFTMVVYEKKIGSING